MNPRPLSNRELAFVGVRVVGVALRVACGRISPSQGGSEIFRLVPFFRPRTER
jgi:hypothetical protein